MHHREETHERRSYQLQRAEYHSRSYKVTIILLLFIIILNITYLSRGACSHHKNDQSYTSERGMRVEFALNKRNTSQLFGMISEENFQILPLI